MSFGQQKYYRKELSKALPRFFSNIISTDNAHWNAFPGKANWSADLSMQIPFCYKQAC